MWISWATRKMNKWIPGQIKLELSLEAKMLKLRLSYSHHEKAEKVEFWRKKWKIKYKMD